MRSSRGAAQQHNTTPTHRHTLHFLDNCHDESKNIGPTSLHCVLGRERPGPARFWPSNVRRGFRPSGSLGSAILPVHCRKAYCTPTAAAACRSLIMVLRPLPVPPILRHFSPGTTYSAECALPFPAVLLSALSLHFSSCVLQKFNAGQMAAKRPRTVLDEGDGSPPPMCA